MVDVGYAEGSIWPFAWGLVGGGWKPLGERLTGLLYLRFRHELLTLEAYLLAVRVDRDSSGDVFHFSFL